MATLQQPSSSSENPEYHHYIPQFILRNYAHPYRPPKGGRRAKPQSKRCGKKGKNHIRRQETALHIIDLSGDNPELTESPVRRTFGLMDMYRDHAKSSKQNYIEEQLSKLESDAARIITKIRKTFESGDEAVWITQQERDILRKFLFIMKYRGKTFHKRFVGDETEGYVAEDKEIFLKYMHENGFEKPVDVWLHTIKVIMDLKLDPQRQWMKEIMNKTYPLDAEWFIAHTEFMYLALCTPSETDAEFILTENCYNVFEGPQTISKDPMTGKGEPTTWTNYHEFAPITPRLIMVLRSFILPNSDEDKNEDIKRWRAEMYRLCAAQHFNPSSAKSILADLPIRKASNSYTCRSPHGLQLLENEDGSRRSDHRFGFPFFKVSTEHVNKINMVFLDNAQACQAVAYTSESALRITIEYYLTLPAGKGFKVVGLHENGPNLSYLMKLENIMKRLGSDKTLVYQSQIAKLTDDEVLESMMQEFAGFVPEHPTETMQLYMKLDGSAATMVCDFDQARKMRNMRIKIDVWSQGLEEDEREDIRNKLRDLFCQLPARRLWHYLKHVRIMSLTGPEDLVYETGEFKEYFEGPEDVIVKASHVISTDKLGRLMHFSVLQHIFLVRNPDFDIDALITMDESGLERLLRISHFAFSPAGSICDCGIGKLQAKAKSVKAILQASETHEKWTNPCWTEEENIEMLTRWIVRDDVESLLGDQLPSDTLQELKDVMFNMIYPTYTKTRSAGLS